MECPLCKRKKKIVGWYYVTMCDTCQVPLIVSTEHKPDFSKEEKKEIEKLFGNKYNIRQKQRDVKNHAHCHLEPK